MNDKPRILVVEDEPSLALTVSDRLLSEGYEVETAADGDRGLARVLEGGFDLVLLDVMLPGKNGFDVCRDLRQRRIDVPVLMLTARGEVFDRVVGLKLGADDYVVKPFEMVELLARIEALLRRARTPISAASGHYVFGEIQIDFQRSEVQSGGVPIPLSALEFKLLAYLIERRGQVIGRDQLLDEVWGYDSDAFTRTVDVHVASLRQKTEMNPSRPQFILTVRGRGYKFVG